MTGTDEESSCGIRDLKILKEIPGERDQKDPICPRVLATNLKSRGKVSLNIVFSAKVCHQPCKLGCLHEGQEKDIVSIMALPCFDETSDT